jgi:hypothetical protein
MSFQYNVTPPAVEAKKLPPGLGIVISAGSAALALGIVITLWLGGNVEKPEIWFAATVATAVLAVCIAAFGFYRDRARAKMEEAEYDEYMEKLRAVDKITRRYKAD